ncbi:hypothetical protein E6C27_scaffold437G001150 [Cucumis melo var. makuwa]|uniref:Uncharacterized protein n=1 Tax=Cucumis melo var. makuwa TaxID=1194695 RepID=A0A5A7UG80_CUCMM|nr:hypothetical protein E6C27_scaffold437G001150 [Cucumis melo var. makuwa]
MNEVEEIGCVGCSSLHTIDACLLNIETITYVKNDPYSNTYNAGWRDHLNFSWGGQGQGDKVVKDIIVMKHLAIVKDVIMIDHTTQHLKINKPPPLPHPFLHL